MHIRLLYSGGGSASHSRRGVAETPLGEVSPHLPTCRSQPMPVTVRLLAASEWPLWRDVSLQSLADSPDAFRPTLAEAIDQPEEFWRGTVASTVVHERCNLWIAVSGDDPVGKVFARIDEEVTTLYIGAMWVAPDLRGAGIGRRLMHAAEEWGKDSGVTRSELWVTEANQVAVHFYESLDYLPADDTQMLREGSRLVVRKLQKTI
jgi:GNAT superfamily N-acetyltransferase